MCNRRSVSIHRPWSVVFAVALVALLGAPTAEALKRRDGDGGPPETCPDETGIQAALTTSGSLLIGVEIFIRAQPGTIIESGMAAGTCQFHAVPLPQFSWQIVSKPAGSAAALVETSTLHPRLLADVAGEYRVRFTACPSGCTVPSTSGGTISVGAETRDIDLSIEDTFAPPPETEPLVPPQSAKPPDPALASDTCAFGADKWNAAWVVAKPWQGARDFRTVTGKVKKSKVSRKDNILNHDSQDHNADVEVDPSSLDLIPASQDDMEVEWEWHHYADRFWPTRSDRITARGYWIRDCAHGARAEIHPPVMTAVHRPRAIEIPDSMGLGTNIWVPGIITDVWVNENAGEITRNCSDTGLHKTGDSELLPPPPTCLPQGAGFSKNPIQELHTFDIHLPRDPVEIIAPLREAPPVPLYIEVQNPLGAAGPDPVIVQDAQHKNVLHVSIDLTSFAGERYSRRIVAGWAYPAPDNWGLRRWKLRINSLRVHDDGDGRLRGDGDWKFWVNTANAGDEWLMLFNCNGCVHGLENFGGRPWETDAATSDRNIGPDLRLYPGQRIYLHSGGFETDWAYTDDTGRVTTTVPQVARSHSKGSFCRRSGMSGCAHYTLNFEIVGGEAVTAELTPEGEAILDGYTIDLGDTQEGTVEALPPLVKDWGLPSDAVLGPDDDVLVFDAGDFIGVQSQEAHIFDIEDEEFLDAVAHVSRADPQALDRWLDELRQDADEVLATELREEALISLGVLRAVLDAELWQQYFGHIKGVPNLE